MAFPSIGGGGMVPGSLNTPGLESAASNLFGTGAGAGAAGGASMMGSIAPWLMGAQILSGLDQAPPPPQHIPQPQQSGSQQPAVSIGELLFDRPTEVSKSPNQFNKAPMFPGV